jgi:hypothetical protein
LVSKNDIDIKMLGYEYIFKNYYDKLKKNTTEINMSNVNLNLINIQNINYSLIYPYIVNQNINLNNEILLSLFNYVDTNLFNSSFENLQYYKCQNCTSSLYSTNFKTELNYLKFVFVSGSPLYRIYFLFTFLSYLTNDLNQNNTEVISDIDILRDLTLLFILNYLSLYENLSLSSYTNDNLSKYNLEIMNNPQYFISSNLLCFDQIDILYNTEFLNMLKNFDSSNFIMFYTNFYFIQQELDIFNIDIANINNIPNICNNFKYNFDDKIILLYLNVLDSNNEFFNNYNNCYTFVLNYFNKYVFDYNNLINSLDVILKSSNIYLENIPNLSSSSSLQLSNWQPTGRIGSPCS